MTERTVNVGLLEEFLSNYYDNIQVAVRVPGGEVYAITGVTVKSVGAHAPLVLELLTEKDLDTRKIKPIKIGDSSGRDNFQP